MEKLGTENVNIIEKRLTFWRHVTIDIEGKLTKGYQCYAKTEKTKGRLETKKELGQMKIEIIIGHYIKDKLEEFRTKLRAYEPGLLQMRNILTSCQ